VDLKKYAQIHSVVMVSFGFFLILNLFISNLLKRYCTNVTTAHKTLPMKDKERNIKSNYF